VGLQDYIATSDRPKRLTPELFDQFWRDAEAFDRRTRTSRAGS
jgi:hypothetical protein